MEFFIRLHIANTHHFSEPVTLNREEDWIREKIQFSLLFPDRHTRVVCLQHGDHTAWLAGDPIIEEKNRESIEKCLHENRYGDLLQMINGHFRLVAIDRSNGAIYVANSLFSILPVYYYSRGSMVCVSSDGRLLAEEAGQQEINKRFVLENVLFYYPLFNETICKDVRLLPAHHIMEINAKGIRLKKHTNLADWYVEQPASWVNAAGNLADLFLERVQHYLPGENYVHSLTAGFDSRSLVSCGIHHQKNFETYSFGHAGASDTRIAEKLAALADLRFNLVSLDKRYVDQHSLEEGLDFVAGSWGSAGFARAHYLYSGKALGRKFRYMITGNFGSEIFRAAHNAGELISPNMYRLFHADSLAAALEKIEGSTEFSWLNKKALKNEWEELKADLETLPPFNPGYSGLTLNEKFYLMVWEEVFRKYFGAEMVNQYRFIINRTPFLDIPFLKAILKTQLAGVYSDFREKNPVKRFRGQVLYAHIIRKAYPAFNDVITDKGYRPADLLSLRGKFRITGNYLNKKFRPRDNDPDPNAVSLAFAENGRFFQNQSPDASFFNVSRFNQAFVSKYEGPDFLIALSQSWFLNRNLEKIKPEKLLV